MKLFKFIALSVIFLGIAACGPQYKTVYDMTPPDDQEGRMCLNQCMESKTYCEQTEHQGRLEEKKVCLSEAKVKADIDYDSYFQTQKKKGLEVEKTYGDFYHPSRCGRTDHLYSPRCESNYRQCFSNCGGVVRENVVCVSGCDQGN